MTMVSMAHECPRSVWVRHGCRSLAQGCSPAMGHATLMVPSYHDSLRHAGWVLDGYPTVSKRRLSTVVVNRPREFGEPSRL
jgi:hypothetical protein